MSLISEFCAGRTPAELFEEYLYPGVFAPFASDLAARARGSAALDIACGTGAIARCIAASSPPYAAPIVAVDVAEPMLDVARRRSAEEGVGAKIDYRLASAAALPFDDDAFDVAFCQQGLQFFPDRTAALSEARRVVKPGGKICLSVWTGADERNPVFAAFERAVEKRLGADLVPLGPFSFGGLGKLTQAAEEVGLSISSAEERTLETRLPDIDSLVLFDVLFLGRPTPDGEMQPVIDPEDPASDDVVRAIIADLERENARFRLSDGTIGAPMTASVVVATV